MRRITFALVVAGAGLALAALSAPANASNTRAGYHVATSADIQASKADVISVATANDNRTTPMTTYVDNPGPGLVSAIYFRDAQALPTPTLIVAPTRDFGHVQRSIDQAGHMTTTATLSAPTTVT